MSEQIIRCPHGCCEYSLTGHFGDGPGWNHWPVGCYTYFCSHDGSRLNPDGTSDPGSEAWELFDGATDYAATRTQRMAAALVEGGVGLEVSETKAEQEAQA